MTKKIFGTDGVRGQANKYPLTPDMIMKLAACIGKKFKKEGKHAGRTTAVIGKDTRLSGYMIEPALTAGLIAVGVDVVLLGPLPTPAVSMITTSLRADIGIMISASHNHFKDNGIKLFDRNGLKLSDKIEKEIEELMGQDINDYLVTTKLMGRAKRLDDAQGRYIEFAKNTFPRKARLDKLRIVVDCANGAAYNVAPKIFWELGAEVISIHDSPNGYNINENCGATNTRSLQKAVKEHRADVGIALDGDADRIVMVDELGEKIDGDKLIALIASNWKKQGTISGNKIVTTVMSNMGLENFLRDNDMELVRTAVGDRYVAEKMREIDANIGGEPSGHVIMRDYTRTGDGIIAALQVLAIMINEKKKLSELGDIYQSVPQVLKNVQFKIDPTTTHNKKIDECIEKQRQILTENNSRLLIRKSGTEPIIRVMAEGKDLNIIEKSVDNIIETMRSEGFLV